MTQEGRETVEQAIIGSILFDPVKGLDYAIHSGLMSTWFEDHTNGRIFKYAMKLHAERGCADFVNIEAFFKNEPEVSDYMVKAMESHLTVAYLPDYIDKLQKYKDHAEALKVTATAEVRLRGTHAFDAPDVYDMIREDFSRIGVDKRLETSLKDATAETIERWKNPDRTTGMILWPIRAMNIHMSPLRKQLVYICAKESVGKTAFLLQMLLRNALNDVMGSMASLESPLEDLSPRLLSQISRVNSLKAEQGETTPEDMEAFEKAAKLLGDLNLSLVSRVMTLEQLHAWAKLMKSRGSQYIMVDNTRHIKIKSTGNVNLDYSIISKGLKEVRDDLGIPMIVLHHSNKEGDDISWTQDLRRDVDILIFLRKNEELSTPPGYEMVGGKTILNNGTSWVDIEIAKNRNGRAGMTHTKQFHTEIQTFDD